MKKEKYTLEYAIRCTVPSLFAKLSTGSGLESWFADRVEGQDDRFVFFWYREPQSASRIKQTENQLVRFRWDEEDEPEAYFELEIVPHELTGDVALVITDFAARDEHEDAVRLWENSVKKLKLALGCR